MDRGIVGIVGLYTAQIVVRRNSSWSSFMEVMDGTPRFVIIARSS